MNLRQHDICLHYRLIFNWDMCWHLSYWILFLRWLITTVWTTNCLSRERAVRLLACLASPYFHPTMTYIPPYACFIILLACVLSCADAFIGGHHHGQAHIQSKRQNQSIQTFISINRNTQIHDDKRISSTITLHANKKDKENDVKERTYTKIDDGSPIGVAIVLLGLLGNIYFPGISFCY